MNAKSAQTADFSEERAFATANPRVHEFDLSLWKSGRVVEGARLESVYRVKSSIEGSNPSSSAITKARHESDGLFFYLDRIPKRIF
jgi:hypothetical protein